MATHTEIVEKVSQLSVLSAELVEEIALLEGGRDALDQRFDANLSHLNQAISQLPVVVDVLMLEKPPPVSSFAMLPCTSPTASLTPDHF